MVVQYGVDVFVIKINFFKIRDKLFKISRLFFLKLKINFFCMFKKYK